MNVTSLTEDLIQLSRCWLSTVLFVKLNIFKIIQLKLIISETLKYLSNPNYSDANNQNEYGAIAWLKKFWCNIVSLQKSTISYCPDLFLSSLCNY